MKTSVKFVFIVFFICLVTIYFVTSHNKSQSSNQNIALTNNILNASVKITATKFGVAEKTGSGSIINQQPIYDEQGMFGGYKLYVLTVAHILTSGCQYYVSGTVYNNGVADYTYTTTCDNTEFVDKDKDISLFTFITPQKLNYKSTSIDIYGDNVFMRSIYVAGYPLSYGPILSEGIVTTVTDDANICNVTCDFGSSGALIYDKETGKILGMIRGMIGVRDEHIAQTCFSVPPKDIEKFLQSIKSLLE
jgi:hypothetical protein